MSLLKHIFRSCLDVRHICNNLGCCNNAALSNAHPPNCMHYGMRCVLFSKKIIIFTDLTTKYFMFHKTDLYNEFEAKNSWMVANFSIPKLENGKSNEPSSVYLRRKIKINSSYGWLVEFRYWTGNHCHGVVHCSMFMVIGIVLQAKEVSIKQTLLVGGQTV